jgi:hypothetical protein
MHLDSSNTTTNVGSKYMTITFHTNKFKKKQHIVCVYKVHSCWMFKFLNNFQTIIQCLSKHYPIII